MATYKINDLFGGYSQSVEAAKYSQRGDYFVFLDENDNKVLTVAARHVQTIDVAE